MGGVQLANPGVQTRVKGVTIINLPCGQWECMGIELYRVSSLCAASFGSNLVSLKGLKRCSTTVPIKNFVVSRCMPDFLTNIMHMAAHRQCFAGYSCQAPFNHNYKCYDTCFEAQVSGHSNKSRSPYIHIAYVIR